MLTILLTILSFPFFIIYLVLCFTIPLIKVGKIKKGKEIKIYIVKDLIHSDFIFEKKHIKDVFKTEKNYLKTGWGDRKIFLETRSWANLKLSDFLKAFWGLNQTVLRTEEMDLLPERMKIIHIDHDQLEKIKQYIKKSYKNELIEKKPEYYQVGNYYESDLKYNCITNCNNWVNSALRTAKISNRIWCPITYWI